MKLASGFADGIEGYISERKNFNGVLFVLKEPNSDNQTSFWFKNCFEEIPQDPVSKKSFTQYCNCFKKLLTYVPFEPELTDCAYANIKSFSGQSSVSVEYSCIKDREKAERVESLIKACNPIVIFVCQDSFDALVKNKNLDIQLLEDGITYKNGEKRLRSMDYNNVKIYEIYHPSCRRGYPDEKT